jgi:pectinesterase
MRLAGHTAVVLAAALLGGCQGGNSGAADAGASGARGQGGFAGSTASATGADAAGGGSGGFTSSGAAADAGGPAGQAGAAMAGASGAAGATTDAGAARGGGPGTSGAAGATSCGGFGGATGGTGGPATLAGTATRPLLAEADAPSYTALAYLAQAGTIGALVTDNWDPTAGLGDASTFSPRYTVAADGSGTHTTVQAAITAAATGGSASRVYILVRPGTYREVVCVAKTAPPITLYGASPDATQVVIVDDNYAAKIPDAGANPCSPPATGATSYGTSASATFASLAPRFRAKNLTISNDYLESAATSSNQAVAFLTQGDQLVFDNVRLLGNQDTLYIKTSSTSVVARAYFKSSYVEGDVDFIFGRGTAVFDGCTLNYLTSRQGSKGGNYLAPSTAAANAYGFLIAGSTFTAASGTPPNLIVLGRAWDESVTCYTPGSSPNGQTLVRASTIAAPIRAAAPWAAAATTGRAFSATGNRLWEYQNTGPGAGAPLPTDGAMPNDGSAADTPVK